MAARLNSDLLDQGWIRLFDGQTLLGWIDAGKANWRVEEGCLVADAGETGLLCTSSRFEDYEIKLEFRSEPHTNSGVFFRTPKQPTAPDKDCFELNIAPPDNPFPTGSLVGRSRVAPAALPDFNPEQWHEFHALLDGSRVRVWVDGNEVLDYQDTTNLHAGHIGLQFREGAVAFRNILLRPVQYETILPSQHQDAWTIINTNLEVDTDGSWLIAGGPGHIELREAFSDFLLQTEFRTEADHANSGLFFRCIPGDVLNGYEMQIHHGWKESRASPTDGGMGAIFRRQAARAVLSDDEQWTRATLVADGNHLATWVEGIQVVDWFDTRDPNENPRLGRRDHAGSLMIQAHDPDCRIRFRKLTVAKLPDAVAPPPNP